MVVTQRLQRFLIVGFTTVVIDFITYRILLYLDSPLVIAKGLGFIAGTAFAYFANKIWTFNRAKGGVYVFSLFVFFFFSDVHLLALML